VIAEVVGADQIDPADRLDPDRLVADIARRGRPARLFRT